MSPIDGIIQFNDERHLYNFDPAAEYGMLLEELQEFYIAYSQSNEDEMVDALCDIIVVATGAINKLGYDPTKALNETVEEISSRQGSFNESTGKWEKDLEQDPSTLYEADYENARK